MNAEYEDRADLLRPVEEWAARAPLVVVQENLFADLRGELGSTSAVTRWLIDIADRIEHPVAVHQPDGTIFLSPRGWTQERLEGWSATHMDVIEAALGATAELVRPADVLQTNG